MIALSQLWCESLAQAYYAKKRAEGKTARSALRCLKRRLVDVVYRLLPTGNLAALDISMSAAA
jgi:transposase